MKRIQRYLGMFLVLVAILILPAGAVGCEVAPTEKKIAQNDIYIDALDKKIAQNDIYIDALDPGIKLYMREKFLEGTETFSGDKIILFVHGATYPSVSGFDSPVSGYSWMNYVARRGFAAYTLDIRGYGGSTRPPEMEVAASQNPPIVTAETAVRDITAAVDYVLKKHNATELNLLGWSWGTVTTAAYAIQSPNKVRRLVLYAPAYAWDRALGKLLADPKNPGQPNMGQGAYRLVTAAKAKWRWDTQIKPKDKTQWRESAVVDAWVKDILASDPTSGTRTPPSLRAPNGVMVDVYYIATNRPIYDASKITVPVLIIRGDDDKDTIEGDVRGLFDNLTSTPYRRYVIIANGTHNILLEKTHLQLKSEVQLFLEE